MSMTNSLFVEIFTGSMPCKSCARAVEKRGGYARDISIIKTEPIKKTRKKKMHAQKPLLFSF